MIRNKRTIFAACINSEDALTARSTVPRLAAPLVDDSTPFHVPTETPEYTCRQKVVPNDNPSGSPQRRHQ
jgi:hypothetical protein